MGVGYRVELTSSSVESCPQHPLDRLRELALTIERGAVIEIVGEEQVFPVRKALRTITNLGLRVVRVSSEHGVYTILAEKN